MFKAGFLTLFMFPFGYDIGKSFKKFAYNTVVHLPFFIVQHFAIQREGYPPRGFILTLVIIAIITFTEILPKEVVDFVQIHYCGKFRRRQRKN